VVQAAQQQMVASFDGRSRITLKNGDSVVIRASEFPVPSVKSDADDYEWFQSIQRKLHWNLNRLEKPSL
jgi:NAD+ kinase